MNKKFDKDNRFAGVQRIIVYLLAIVALLYAAANVLPTSGQNQLTVLDQATQVTGEDQNIFGNILLSCTDGLSLDYAYILQNGEQVGDFGDGELLLRVHPGDTLAVDGSAYSRELVFYVQAASSNIDQEFLAPSIFTKGNIAQVGVIVFK